MNTRLMTAIAALSAALAGEHYDHTQAQEGARATGRHRLRLGTTHPRGNHHDHARRKNPIPGWLRTKSA